MASRSLHAAVMVRAFASLIVGVIVAVIFWASLGAAAALLAGWATLAIVNVVWVTLIVWPMDAAQTRAHATAEDPGRQTARVIAIAGSIVSLVAVVVVLMQTTEASHATTFVYAGLAVLSVAASWALIQTDYLLRYAHLYYSHPVGGIDFNQVDDPCYTDFAYFSLGLGMTYQVADTNVRTNEIRRVVIAQTLLAYLFATVIVATVINLVTSLG